MGAMLRITRTDHTGTQLRALSVKCSDSAQVRRMLALAMVMDGRPRAEAASLNAMDRQTLCDWVRRYNDGGLDGLKTRKSPGQMPLLTKDQKAELYDLVVRGPDPAIHKVVRWRCVDLRAEVARRWFVEVHESTIGKWLGELDLTRLQPRPVHPKKDAEAEAVLKNFCQPGARGAQRHPGRCADRDLVSGRGQGRSKGTHAYVWAPIGSRPLMVRDNRQDSAYIFGAICPQRGVGAAMIMPNANMEMMNLHLAEINTQIARGARAVLVRDGAGWHQRGKQLKVPDNITLLSLPP